MANALEFILKLTDMLTPGMRQAAAITDSSAARIQRQMEQTAGSSKKMTASVDELRSRLEGLNRVRFSTRIKSEFDTATRSARDLERQISRLEGRGSAGMGGMLGGIAASVGIATIGKEIFSQAANAESQKIAFKVMTGSAGAGNKMYADINKMADVTPFESQDLGRSAKTMLSYGIDKSKIMPTLNMLGDVAAATDAPKESLQSLSLAFGQVAAKGHLAGQETLQMINAGFNPLKEISDITGISMNNLAKAQEKGIITTEMVAAAFQHATGPGGKFHNMMEEQSKTLGGKWSTFMDGVHHKLRDLGEFLKPVALGITDFATNLMNAEPYTLAFTGAIAAFTTAVYWNTMATKTAAIATRIWAGAQSFLNLVMMANPIVLVIAAVVAIAAAVIYAYNHFGKFRGFVLGAWEAIKGFGFMIKDFFIDIIMGMVKGIAGVGQALYYLFTGEFKKAFETGNEAVKNLLGVNAVKHAIDNGKKIGAAVSAGYDQGVKELSTPALKVKKVGQNPINPTNAAFNGLGKFKAGTESSNGNSDTGKSRSDNISSGGQRSIVINIGKMIEKVENHVMSAKEGAAEMEREIVEAVRRVIYSINSEATN